MLARFLVTGHSMEPKFSEGDFVLIRKFGHPRVGDVVVINYKGQQLLKRVARINGTQIITRGDNHDKVFTINHDAVIGKLLFHVKR